MHRRNFFKHLGFLVAAAVSAALSYFGSRGDAQAHVIRISQKPGGPQDKAPETKCSLKDPVPRCPKDVTK